MTGETTPTACGAANRAVAVVLVAALVIAACGESEDTSEAATIAPEPTTALVDSTTTESEDTTPPDATTPDTTVPTSGAASDEWRASVSEACDEAANVLASGTSPPEDPAGYVTFWRDAATEPLPVPADAPDIVTEIGGPDEVFAAQLELLDEAERLLAAGDFAGAEAAAQQHADLIFHLAAAVAVAGGTCALFGPPNVEAARLNVPLLGGWQIGSGFESIWVSREFSNDLERLDPISGDIVATIDVGSLPIKLQAASGQMWVRTADAYVAIDPTSNDVVTTLAKSDVGPEANRSWAVDGALWICDGTRLHRYDPTTLSVVATIELGFACGQVYATDELVVPWSYNEDEGESGASMAALIDPASNEVLHSVPLPADAFVPVVLDETVYFAAGTRAFTVDRATGSVSEAPALDREVVGSQPAFDGTSIYLPAKDTDEIMVVDASTLQVTEVFPTLGLNSMEFVDGTLWTANNFSGYTQAFDRPA